MPHLPIVGKLVHRVLFLFALFFVLVLGVQNEVVAEDNPIVRIEENWELDITTPDINSNGPQIVTAIAPLGNLDSLYVTFEVNHGTAPASAAGGLHLQVWRGEEHLTTKSFPESDALATTGEVIRWTQAMELQNGQIIFEIVNGQSATWGQFGNQGNLKASVASSLTSLANYTPVVSLTSSGVTYATHCVSCLKLCSVRAVRADGTVISVVLNRTVYPQDTASP